jgi:hypothetical protein
MFKALVSALLLAGACAHARQITPAQMKARQHMALEARRATLLDLAPGPIDLDASHVEKRASGPKNITFSNPKASGKQPSQYVNLDLHRFFFKRILCRRQDDS